MRTNITLTRDYTRFRLSPGRARSPPKRRLRSGQGIARQEGEHAASSDFL